MQPNIIYMRILHLPVVYGRQAWGLSRAERALGHNSDFVAFENTFGKTPCDRLLFSTEDGVFKRELKRWNLFLTSIFRYDVFHFHFGQKFFTLNPRPWKTGDTSSQALLRFFYFLYSLVVGRLDLWVLRLLGKKMFMTYHGDDIRQGDRSRELFKVHFADEVDSVYYNPYTDARKRKSAELYACYCKQIFAISPDLLPMSPRGARLIRHAGIDQSEWRQTESHNPKPLIVHAPTHREVKGTKYILAAVEKLKSRGYEFDFKLIEKMTNLEAREWYAKADLVVDQIFLGWYGVLAIECMALGKPVISYIRKEDTKLVSSELVKDIPVISAEPKTIENKIAWCLEHTAELKEIGKKSRAFVEKWYDPIEIAKEVIEIYKK